MPNIKSAGKRAELSQLNMIKNRAVKSLILTTNKAFLKAISEGDKKKAEETFRTLCSILDKSAKRRIIKPNNASRKKSRAASKLKSLK